MSALGKLRVTTIVEEWNMNCVHKLRDAKGAKSLRSGDCLVAFNKRMTIGRIIDYAGGVHTYYAPPKQVFDVDRLSELIARGFFVELRVGANTRAQADKLRQAA